MKKTLLLIVFTFLITPILSAEEKFCDDKGHCYTKQEDSSHWADTLINQGAVPAGASPKVIVEEGGEPGYYQTDALSTASRGLDKLQKEQQEREDRDLTRKQKAVKLYKNLVDSGYTPMQAWETALKDLGFPPPDEGKTNK